MSLALPGFLARARTELLAVPVVARTGTSVNSVREQNSWDQHEAMTAVLECFGSIPDCVSFAGSGVHTRVVFEVRKETPSYGGVPMRESSKFALYMRQQLASGRWPDLSDLQSGTR